MSPRLVTTKPFEVHTHAYCEHIPSAYAPKRVRHSHADGSRCHYHESSAHSIGPAHFERPNRLGRGKEKYTAKPNGEQLPYVEPTFEQSHFKVIFCDNGYTRELERAGIDRAEWEETRDDFKAVSAGAPIPLRPRYAQGGAAVARMVNTFDLTPIYEYEGPTTKADEG